MSLDAVALLRVTGWEPDEDLDVRELDDGFLVFLEAPYGDADAMLEALIDEVGPEIVASHEDDRGVLFFPDVAEPEDADTYDAVLEAVGDQGIFAAFGIDDDEGEGQVGIDPNAVRGVLDDALQALGFGGMDDLQKLLSGDEEALKMAQIHVHNVLGQQLAGMTGQGNPDVEETKDAEPAGLEPKSDASADEKKEPEKKP